MSQAQSPVVPIASVVEVEGDFFRRFEDLLPVGKGASQKLMNHEIILATPAAWVGRPESSDTTWNLKRDAFPMVLATRSIA